MNPHLVINPISRMNVSWVHFCKTQRSFKLYVSSGWMFCFTPQTVLKKTLLLTQKHGKVLQMSAGVNAPPSPPSWWQSAGRLLTWSWCETVPNCLWFAETFILTRLLEHVVIICVLKEKQCDSSMCFNGTEEEISGVHRTCQRTHSLSEHEVWNIKCEQSSERTSREVTDTRRLNLEKLSWSLVCS